MSYRGSKPEFARKDSHTDLTKGNALLAISKNNGWRWWLRKEVQLQIAGIDGLEKAGQRSLFPAIASFTALGDMGEQVVVKPAMKYVT